MYQCDEELLLSMSTIYSKVYYKICNVNGSSGVYLQGITVWEAHHNVNFFQIKRLEVKKQS